MTSRDEVGDLGRAFDHLADASAERTAALEASLADSALVAAIVAASQDAVVSKDLAGVVTSWNPGATRLYGYTAEEAIGQQVNFLFPPGFEEEDRLAMAVLRRGESMGPIESKRVRKDGEIIDVSISLAPIRDGSGAVVGGAIIEQDIRRRVLVELALAEGTRKLEHMAEVVAIQTAALEASLADSALVAAIVAASQDAVVSKDLAGVVTSWNPGATRLYGYTAEEAIGQRVSFLFPPGFEEEDRLAMAVLRRGESMEPIESKRVRKGGELIDVSISLAPIRDGGGAVVGGAIIEQDIRRRVLVELALAERTRELEAAVKELGSFSYTISHDLRAPIRALDGFSRILIDEHASEMSDEAQRYLHLVRSNAEQMGHLVDDLLAFSRLSRQALEKQLVDPASIARGLLDDLLRDRENRQIDVSIGDLPSCWADPALLRQVFANLLGNAVKFTGQREIGSIEVGSRIENDETVYFVKDNGAGFDMKYANKLFGVFQRLHRAADFEGTGVGLAIVQRIVVRHGGSVWAEAEVDKGATFSFTLGGTNGVGE